MRIPMLHFKTTVALRCFVNGSRSTGLDRFSSYRCVYCSVDVEAFKCKEKCSCDNSFLSHGSRNGLETVELLKQARIMIMMIEKERPGQITEGNWE